MPQGFSNSVSKGAMEDSVKETVKMLYSVPPSNTPSMIVGSKLVPPFCQPLGSTLLLKHSR